MKKGTQFLIGIMFLMPIQRIYSQNIPSGHSGGKDINASGNITSQPSEMWQSGEYKAANNDKKITNNNKEAKIANYNQPPVAINLNVRESDVFKSHVVAKYVSVERLNNMALKNPGRINLVDFYFNKSFSFELIPGMQCEQKTIDNFIAQFDPYSVESQRKQTQEAAIEFPDAGVRVILLPKNDISVEIQKFILKFENRGKGDFHDGKMVPEKTGSMINNK